MQRTWRRTSGVWAVWLIAATAVVAAKPKPSRTVATVNGDKITYGQLEPLLRQAPAAEGEETPARELQREALGLLIDDLLMTQYLRKHVPPPTEEEIERRMTELTTALAKDKRTLAQMCKETQQTEAEVRQNLVQLLQWSNFAKKRITDADLEKYYRDGKDLFDRVRVRASHIFVRVSATTAPSEKQAIRERLQAVRAQILAGQLDFVNAAKQHSQCPSAQNGGDIGHFPRKFVVEESFAQAAFSLQIGQISDVVETQVGLHLIKVTGRDPGRPSNFADIKDMVREVYLDELRQNILARMRRDAKIEVLLP